VCGCERNQFCQPSHNPGPPSTVSKQRSRTTPSIIRAVEGGQVKVIVSCNWSKERSPDGRRYRNKKKEWAVGGGTPETGRAVSVEYLAPSINTMLARNLVTIIIGIKIDLNLSQCIYFSRSKASHDGLT